MKVDQRKAVKNIDILMDSKPKKAKSNFATSYLIIQMDSSKENCLKKIYVLLRSERGATIGVPHAASFIVSIQFKYVISFSNSNWLRIQFS